MDRPLYVELECQLQPRRTPFDGNAAQDAGALFVYLSARRVEGWTPLFDAQAKYWDEFERRIPMGYTQLWLMEKVYCAQPAKLRTAPRTVALDDYRYPPQQLARRDWADSLYLVLREPRHRATESDVVAYLQESKQARRAAQHYAWKEQRAAVVALMRRDLQWH